MARSAAYQLLSLAQSSVLKGKRKIAWLTLSIEQKRKRSIGGAAEGEREANHELCFMHLFALFSAHNKPLSQWP